MYWDDAKLVVIGGIVLLSIGLFLMYKPLGIMFLGICAIAAGLKKLEEDK